MSSDKDVIVTALEELLQRAKRGEVRGLVCMSFGPNMEWDHFNAGSSAAIEYTPALIGILKVVSDTLSAKFIEHININREVH